MTMDFLKKVLILTAIYFLVVLLWILYADEKMNLFFLGLQAVSFGIIAGGFLIFSDCCNDMNFFGKKIRK